MKRDADADYEPLYKFNSTKKNIETWSNIRTQALMEILNWLSVGT